MGEATSNAAPYTARKMLTHVWTSSSWMSARSVKANGKTGTTVYLKKKKLNQVGSMVMIMVCYVSVLGSPRGEDWSGEREKHTDSISENVRKHRRGDHDDDESFAAPEL